MIDFEITQDNFSKAARLMTKVRTSTATEVIDLTCYAGNVKFVVTGREFTCPAAVESKGLARLPLDIMPKLRKVAATFGDKPFRIRVENGRIKVNSMSVTHDAITIRHMSDRPIDIPDDARPIDILALRYLFTQEEVVDSDLAQRYLAENSQRIQRIDSAAQTLADYEISAEAIESLVTAAIMAHAGKLRPMLKPALGTSSIN